MHAILQDLPLPARLAPWPKASLTTLTRCLLLAALLHLWLVLWLGNAPGGTAPLGQGVFGAINVSLRGPVTAGAAAVVVPPAPDNVRPGDAAVPRWGGAVRSVEPPADSEPGSARLGQRTRLPPVSSPAPVVPFPSPSTTVVPFPSPSAPVVPSAAALPAAPAPQQTLQTAPSDPQPGRVLQEMPASQVPDLAREPLSASGPPLPATAALPAVPAPNAVIAAAQRQLVSPLSQATAAQAVAPLPPLAPAAALPELAALPPAAQASALLRHLQAVPAAARAPAPALSRSEDLATAVLPAPVALPSVGVAAARAGADDAGAQVGRDVATPPAAAASAAPRLNLELARPRGGELSRYSTSGVLPVLPRLPERDEKLAREIEKAARTDCRHAYGGMGPLAVIPLAVDALRKEGGCKW